MRLLNAFLLAIAVVALASAAELIFMESSVFLLSGALALAAVACEAGIFSYIMTEATIFSIYGVFALVNVLAWRTGRSRYFVLGGLLLGLLCLTKPSFLLLFPLALALSALYLYRLAKPRPPHTLRHLLAFSLAFACIVGAWMTRNLVSVGKFAFTQEYGAAVLIERFAYDDMTAREFFQAFPYCTPGIGELAFDLVNGKDSMHRFTYFTKDSFFNTGRDRRKALVAQYGRLDPLISGIVLDEMRTNWWRHLLVSIPLAWCGMWAGWIASLPLIPLFAWGCIRAARTRQPLFLLYAVPPIVNLALDGLIGNHYTRYNLILIGPYAIGAAFIISSWLGSGRWRWQLLAPKPLSTPSAIAVSDEDST
jgi:4-amino-4-deoxy-L-arabinose transferase-like glycosyltransferase